MGPTCAIVNVRGSFLFLLFLVFRQRVLSDLISKPMDSESLLNETTYFNCSSSITAKEIDWYHYPVGAEAHQGKSVYAFGKFYTGYQEDFVLEKNSSSGTYNLVIKSVKPSYAGRFECRDNGAHSYSAQLIVLDDGPECNSNINPYGVIGTNACGIQPDELHLSCSISYHGNIHPELKWHRLGENDPISENVTKSQSANRFTYNLTIKGDQLRDKSSFECQTTKSRTSKHSCTSETVKLLCSVTIDSGGSSATPVWVPIVVVVIFICVLGILFALFIILRRKLEHRGTLFGLFKTLETEERELEEAIPLNEVPMQDASPLCEQDKETTEPEVEEKKVKDGTNPVTENSTEEAVPLLQIPGITILPSKF